MFGMHNARYKSVMGYCESTNMQARTVEYRNLWQQLVQEIADIEELIADARKPEDTQALWSLHLLQSNLKLKRRQLKQHLVGQRA